jgi:hypothetical protein
MNVIHAITLEGIAGPEPGILLLGTLGLIAPVLGPLDVRGLSEDACLDKGPNVHPDAVVEVRVSADRLFTADGVMSSRWSHTEFLVN